jgi:hypothetical protein
VYPVGLNYIIIIILHAIYRYIHLKFFRIYDPITTMEGVRRWPCYILAVYSIYLCICTSGPLVPGPSNRWRPFLLLLLFFLDARRWVFCAFHTRPDLLSLVKLFFLSCDARRISPPRKHYTSTLYTHARTPIKHTQNSNAM